MSKAFQEYRELYDYFGRGGLPRLSAGEFEVLHREFRQLLERLDELTDEETVRVMELKALLLRDRPRDAEILRAARRRRR